MIEIWDYFMRRKKLLCLVLALFFASSLISYQALHQETPPAPAEPQTTTYITIADWGNTNPEVLSPTEVAELPAFSLPQDDYALPDFQQNPQLAAAPAYSISDIPSSVASVNPTPEIPNLGGENTPESNTFVFGDIILSLLGAASLALIAYLTRQHFTR